MAIQLVPRPERDGAASELRELLIINIERIVHSLSLTKTLEVLLALHGVEITVLSQTSWRQLH